MSNERSRETDQNPPKTQRKRATPHAARGQRKTAVTRRLTTQARPTRGGSVHAPSGGMSGDQRGALAKRKGIEATSDLRHLTDLTDS